MICSLLRKTELEEFKSWLDSEMVAYDVIKYGPEVLRINVPGRSFRWNYISCPIYKSDYFVNNVTLDDLIVKFNTRIKS